MYILSSTPGIWKSSSDEPCTPNVQGAVPPRIRLLRIFVLSTESLTVAPTHTLECVGVVNISVGRPSPRELPGVLNKIKLFALLENPFPPENPFNNK